MQSVRANMTGRVGRLWTVRPLVGVVAAAVLVGCDRAPQGLSAGRNEPKPEYGKAIAAVERLGVVARANETGDVTYLDFYPVRDIPAAIVHLKNFPDLTLLNFSGTNLTDEDLVHVAEAKNLEELGLHGTRVTDAGLAHLEGLTSLRVLNLNDTAVGDAGLAHLSGLTNLEQLRLQSTNVTDAGLAHIAPLERLSVVWLSGSQVTSEGVDRLKESLPEADIVHTKIVDQSDLPLLPASAFEQ